MSNTRTKVKKPTLVIEAIVDRDLYFWHANVGAPGSLNDIVTNSSPFLTNPHNNNAPSVEFVVNECTYRTKYYPADGTYLKLAVFVNTIRVFQLKSEQKFISRQEREHKDIERVYGLPKAR